jgi:micrococcal nuclease
MIACRLLLALLLCALPLVAHAEKFSGRVIVVIDGDTVLVLKHGHPLKVRLADIDAPEVEHAGMGGQPPNPQKSQPYGLASRDALKQMVLHKIVEVDTLAIDKYGRTVALLKMGALNVNEEMVRRGMAWEYSHFHSDRHYIASQQQARQARRGLWRQADPVPPWQWRLQHPTGETARH